MSLLFDMVWRHISSMLTGYANKTVYYIKSGFSEEVGAEDMFGIHGDIYSTWVYNNSIWMSLFRENKKKIYSLKLVLMSLYVELYDTGPHPKVALHFEEWECPIDL